MTWQKLSKKGSLDKGSNVTPGLFIAGGGIWEVGANLGLFTPSPMGGPGVRAKVQIRLQAFE